MRVETNPGGSISTVVNPGDGNDTVGRALETASLFAQGGNDIITTRSGADFVEMLVTKVHFSKKMLVAK